MARCKPNMIPGLKAIQAFSPNDLSNIFLIYINAHVKIRNMDRQSATFEDLIFSHISQIEESL